MVGPTISSKLKALGGPLQVLRAGIDAVPAVKYALGVAGVAAAVAIAVSFFSSASAALVGTAVMFGLMVLLVVVAAITGLVGEDIRLPALVLTWAILLLFVGSATLLASSVFFDWPKPVADLLGLRGGPDPRNGPIAGDEPAKVPVPTETRIVNQELKIGQLPESMLLPIDLRLPEKELRSELARRGSLTLDNSRLIVGDLGESISASLAVHTLKLLNGSRIVTNGNSLNLVADRFIFSNGTIISYPEQNRTPSPAPPGSPGVSGGWGGTVALAAFRPPEGRVKVSLHGQDGGEGGRGAEGAQGPPGDRGSDGVNGLVDCRHGGGDGDRGKPGGKGGTGLPGGDAGNGGKLVLAMAFRAATSYIDFEADPGKPGRGGAGGQGGPGGRGGQGGSGSTWCSGGSSGPPGPSGPEGESGTPGAPGKTGELVPSGAVAATRAQPDAKPHKP